MIIYFCAAWLLGLLSALAVAAVVRRSPLAALIAADSGSLLLVASLAVIAAGSRDLFALDVAVFAALLSFLQVVAAARFLRGRGLYE